MEMHFVLGRFLIQDLNHCDFVSPRDIQHFYWPLRWWWVSLGLLIITDDVIKQEQP